MLFRPPRKKFKRRPGYGWGTQPMSRQERAKILNICYQYLNYGNVLFGKQFNVLGGVLKTLRMKQLMGTAEEPETERLAIIIERVLARRYHAKTGVMYINRKNKKTLGLGVLTQDNKFVVLVGSKCAAKEEASLRSVHRKRRKNLLKNMATYDNGENMWLKEAISFDSPSAAACFVTGSPSSGNHCWRDNTGARLGTLNKE